ncbi:Mesoderm posterior protein 1 [Dissostichus eleginoides]|uniref:Mesoderm posterior protein 1 n=1 Tax=Dissostichus eleginoides TaxID=100907 RepID=A0AAD9BZH3_DISEL|nr:Mesoderm posterior protein 1 [Dissostichus eleginoides]
MRDLTKSLNHLRTYLPESVAPEGQTLTKIDTLRLTIRYISYLSAQLGLSGRFWSRKHQNLFKNPKICSSSWVSRQRATPSRKQTFPP